jgi:adenylate kinase
VNTIITGCSGVGKSTVRRAMADGFRQQGFDVAELDFRISSHRKMLRDVLRTPTNALVLEVPDNMKDELAMFFAEEGVFAGCVGFEMALTMFDQHVEVRRTANRHQVKATKYWPER